MDFEQFWGDFLGGAIEVGIKLAISLVIIFLSFRLITLISRRFEKKLINGKRKLDKTLTATMLYLARILLKAVISICVVGYLGVDTSGLAALVASLGVGVGLAVNGALSNFAGGALLLITRPFKIDDFIEVKGHSGVVEDIHITQTRLRTPDNKVIYIPNGALSSDTIVNYSEKDTRRVDLGFQVDYSTDIDKAKAYIVAVIEKHPFIHTEPAPFVRVTEHGESGITVTVRVWTKNADYWSVRFDLLEEIKTAFDKSGITIPYNQLDVHLK